jgi:hypothetical protein
VLRDHERRTTLQLDGKAELGYGQGTVDKGCKAFRQKIAHARLIVGRDGPGHPLSLGDLRAVVHRHQYRGRRAGGVSQSAFARFSNCVMIMRLVLIPHTKARHG